MLYAMSSMRIILLQDVKKVGQRGSVVTVADGYAQNVLLPKKLATPATPENLKRIERERKGAKERTALDTVFAKKVLNFNQSTRQVYLLNDNYFIPLKFVREDMKLKSTFFTIKEEGDNVVF